MLRKRVITALWSIPLLIAVVWFDAPLPWFTVLLAIWGVLASFEFYRLVAAARVPPLTYFGLVWVLLLILSRDADLLATLGPYLDPTRLTPLLLITAALLPPIWSLIRGQPESLFSRWAWTVAGILYTGWLLSHLVALRGLDEGRNWVFLALFATFASDSAAFFVGRAWGKRRLAPSISPGKTWEGAIGGILAAIIVCLLFTLSTPLSLPLSAGQAILLGLLVSLFGQLGDLLESLFKRQMGVKDSSRLIPGHGGLLDRMDSVVLAGMVVYYYVIWVIP